MEFSFASSALQSMAASASWSIANSNRFAIGRVAARQIQHLHVRVVVVEMLVALQSQSNSATQQTLGPCHRRTLRRCCSAEKQPFKLCSLRRCCGKCSWCCRYAACGACVVDFAHLRVAAYIAFVRAASPGCRRAIGSLLQLLHTRIM